MRFKKRLMNILLSAAVVIGSIAVPAATVSAANTLPAFPGAEGAGMYATGGRGGTVRIVTNLNDSGEGSFREAVSHSNSIVVFAVGGTINLTGGDVVVKGNVTVLGQTAPGGAGITLKNGKIGMGGSNTIIRYISSRPGERGAAFKDGYDAWGGSDGANSIVDHCSIGWSTDEQFGLYSKNVNQTVQYTIIGPANCVSYHVKGAHGFGAMFGRGQNSWHHNLIVHNLSRNFRGKVVQRETMDFVNNVIYDWGYQTGYGTMGHINYVNNYLKAGNSTSGAYHFLKADGLDRDMYSFYLTGNKIVKKDGTPYKQSLNDNNWNGGIEYTGTYTEADYRSDKPFVVKDVNGNDASVVNGNIETADEAFNTVVSYVGAARSADKRTKIDKEVTEDAKNGTGNLTGSRDFSTITDTDVLNRIKTNHITQINYDDYYPAAILDQEITDNDKDGMDDAWESERGLDPNNASDNKGDYLGEGYMNIEYYANDLTVNSFPEGVVTKSPKLIDLGEDYDMVIADANALKLSPTTIKNASDLTLPTAGSVNGSSIKWSSASSAVKISNNAISAVNRPSDKDASVILTAEITHGTFTLKRSYTITVKSTAAKWTASESDNGKRSGSELIDGLTTLHDTTGGTTNVTLNDKNYTYYISGADSGSWSNGKAIGTGFKYVPEKSGYLNVYLTSLGQAAKEDGTKANPKTAYIMKEGAETEKDCVASVTGEGNDAVLTGKVEAGQTYYIYVAGSKGRFLGMEITNEAPTLMWKASKNVTKGETLMTGLIANDDMTFTAGNRTIDSVAFTGKLTCANTPADGGASGMALTYTPETKGVITVYYKLNSGKTFVIHEPGKTADEELAMYKTNNDSANIYTSTSANLEAGKTYYIYVENSKAEFYGISFESTEGEPDPDIKPDAPDPTMPPLEGETWTFDNIEAGTVFYDGDKIANENDMEIKVNHGAVGSDPIIAEKSVGSSDHYLKIDDQGAGQDGWTYVAEEPVESEIIVIDFDFMSGDTNKDTVLLRAFDNINVNPGNSYVSATTLDGRIFELKTGENGKEKTPCLKITDYFSDGGVSSSGSPKGLDATLGSFTYKANTWYSLRVQYTSSNNSITVYNKNADGTYGKIGTVELGSGTTKGEIPALNITSVGGSTRGSAANLLGIDNISVLAPECSKPAEPVETPEPAETAKPGPTVTATPKPAETAKPGPTVTATPKPAETAEPGPTVTATPEPAESAEPNPTDEPSGQPVVEFTQDGEKIDAFADGEVTFAASGLDESCSVIIVGYDETGLAIKTVMTEFDPLNDSDGASASAALTPTADMVTIRGFIWNNTDNIKPMSDAYEINRK